MASSLVLASVALASVWLRLLAISGIFFGSGFFGTGLCSSGFCVALASGASQLRFEIWKPCKCKCRFSERLGGVSAAILTLAANAF